MAVINPSALAYSNNKLAYSEALHQGGIWWNFELQITKIQAFSFGCLTARFQSAVTQFTHNFNLCECCITSLTEKRFLSICKHSDISNVWTTLVHVILNFTSGELRGMNCRQHLWCVYPTTELEIVCAVATAVENNQIIKVGTKHGHSFPKLSTCPGSSSGFGLIISTKSYTSKLSIYRHISHDCHRTERHPVEGSAWRQLPTKALHFQVSPYWEALALGGLLATGTHGSSHFGLGGAVHEYVIETIEHGVTGNSSWRVCQSYNSLPNWPRPECHEGVPGISAGCCVNGDAAIGTHIQEKCDISGCQHTSRDGGQNTGDCQTLCFWLCHLVPFHVYTKLSTALMSSESQRINATGYGVSRFCGFQARPATEFEFARSLGKPPVTQSLIPD